MYMTSVRTKTYLANKIQNKVIDIFSLDFDCFYQNIFLCVYLDNAKQNINRNQYLHFAYMFI